VFETEQSARFLDADRVSKLCGEPVRQAPIDEGLGGLRLRRDLSEHGIDESADPLSPNRANRCDGFVDCREARHAVEREELVSRTQKMAHRRWVPLGQAPWNVRRERVQKPAPNAEGAIDNFGSESALSRIELWVAFELAVERSRSVCRVTKDALDHARGNEPPVRSVSPPVGRRPQTRPDGSRVTQRVP
jgi:hypothetical protein